MCLSQFAVVNLSLMAGALTNQLFYFPRLAIWTGLENKSLIFVVCFLPSRGGEVQRTAQLHRPCERGSLRTEHLKKMLIGWGVAEPQDGATIKMLIGCRSGRAPR